VSMVSDEVYASRSDRTTGSGLVRQDLVPG
jgi:hypothetical protein